MKYVLYFGFWIALFYAVIKFGMSVITEQGKEPEGAVHVDPVCGMNVEDARLTSQFDGKTYYFCSDVCKKAFEKEPHRYIKS